MDSSAYRPRQQVRPDISGLDVLDLDWVRPVADGGSGGTLVEVASVPGGGVVVRDSAEPDRLVGFSGAAFAVFLRGVLAGRFDRFRTVADRP